MYLIAGALLETSAALMPQEDDMFFIHEVFSLRLHI